MNLLHISTPSPVSWGQRGNLLSQLIISPKKHSFIRNQTVAHYGVAGHGKPQPIGVNHQPITTYWGVYLPIGVWATTTTTYWGVGTGE